MVFEKYDSWRNSFFYVNYRIIELIKNKIDYEISEHI